MNDNDAMSFLDPEPHGFIYLGFTAQYQTAPVYRQTPQRREAGHSLPEEAEVILGRPDVESVGQFGDLAVGVAFGDQP